MKIKIGAKKRLTCTNNARILYEVLRRVLVVDATAKKLSDKLATLQREIKTLQRQARSIQEALELAGVRPTDIDPIEEGTDWRYADEMPFMNLSLVDTCKRILMDHAGVGLTKSQVEYLAATGGYGFLGTANPKNSVEITLRRLSTAGFCQVDKGSGPNASKYIYIEGKDESEE
jgi:hypothetical protein